MLNVLRKRVGKLSVLSFVVFILVGAAGLFSLYLLLMTNFLKGMGLPEQVAIVLLIIGGLNWGIVAISRDKMMDLFGWLKL